MDESGDFGFSKKGASQWYVFSLVFHDQSHSLRQPLEKLSQHLKELDYPSDHPIHTGPLIRRECPYHVEDSDKRRKLLYTMRNFARNLPVQVQSFIFDKQRWNSLERLQARMTHELGLFFQNALAYFQSYDSIVLYYDNGQTDLGRILNTTFKDFLNGEIKRAVTHQKYRLFQLADYYCTLAFIRAKYNADCLTKSEKAFFKNKELKKAFIKDLEDKSFDPYHKKK